MEHIQYRFMRIEDIDEVMEVEHSSFTLPWTKESFYYELEQNHFAHYLVVVVNDKVAGYCGSWIILDEAHVTNIAVLPQYRGRGFGEALLRKMMELARGLGAKTMTLEVRVSNMPAQSLYKKLGFQKGGIRKGYYTDNQEDALIMWVNL
ncbi:ribosomal protein S18-alanine N-acetyltransferase [Bacillus smithii]|jgi:ribosomal-protein-alanine N-acetyltransferase|uniref:ribosomal protein S18-alanine N-acetyltransferase n=1 Tax=Bacillus smithii TaxID=1479 RepID=UPI003D1B0AEA